jgi:menaquinone-dependent protoporphyrinogen IX oxidase
MYELPLARIKRYGRPWRRLKRALLRRIASHEGGPTDVAQDYELTDWSEVDRFAHSFFVDELG